jgi:hypothetical protein
MTVDPDPTELSAPRDPASYGRPRLMGVGFWAMIALAVICVAAGAGIATFGTHLFPPKTEPTAEPVPPSRTETAPVAPETFAALTPAPVEPLADRSVQFGQLTARLDNLEAGQARTAEAAAAALAAAALLEAAQTSRPFTDELAALDRVSLPSAELRALHGLAATGAPSRMALATQFPEYAARAAGASRATGDGRGLWARIQATLSRVVMIRRVGDLPGKGVDALLAQAERQLDDGDVEHALRTLDELPPAGREAVEPWVARARTRAEIDRRVSAVRTQALEDLARLARSGA